MHLKCRKLLIAIYAVIANTPLTANAAGESCNALLNLGLYNVAQSSSASDAKSTALSTFCSADYSKLETSSSEAAAIRESLNIAARGSYGIASGSGSLNKSSEQTNSANSATIVTTQKQLCTSGFNSSAYSANASSNSRTVYQGSLNAWNKCQELANKDSGFVVQLSEKLYGVTVSITAIPGTEATFYGVTQQGLGQSLCTVNQKPFNEKSEPFKFTAASKVHVVCSRQLQKTGDDVTADAQALIFATSADVVTVNLPAIKPIPPEIIIHDRYRDNGDGTVTDITTNLIWKRCSEGQTWHNGTCEGEASTMKWDDAMPNAQQKSWDSFARYSDWRVPTVMELKTLVDCSSGKRKVGNDNAGELCEGEYQRPNIDQTVFPNTPANWFWTASPHDDSCCSFIVYFNDYFNDNGYVTNSSRYATALVRCVRVGQ